MSSFAISVYWNYPKDIFRDKRYASAKVFNCELLLPKLAKNATAKPMSITHHMIMKNMMSKAAAAMISEYDDNFLEKVKY